MKQKFLVCDSKEDSFQCRVFKQQHTKYKKIRIKTQFLFFISIHHDYNPYHVPKTPYKVNARNGTDFSIASRNRQPSYRLFICTCHLLVIEIHKNKMSRNRTIYLIEDYRGVITQKKKNGPRCRHNVIPILQPIYNFYYKSSQFAQHSIVMGCMGEAYTCPTAKSVLW